MYLRRTAKRKIEPSGISPPATVFAVKPLACSAVISSKRAARSIGPERATDECEEERQGAAERSNAVGDAEDEHRRDTVPAVQA
jgi:hypothetical protein